MVAGQRTGILIIFDGFGINEEERHNAVALANAPNFKRLWTSYPHAKLDASESHVGLPEGFMGNSEVGHLNMGAGRVVYQDFSLISKAIDDGSFAHNPALVHAMETVKNSPKGKGTLHLMGLLSDGGVHSHNTHLYALLKMARQMEISSVAIHCFMDGRDTSPTSGVGYLRELKEKIKEIGVGFIASVSGRFYAMDRDKRWERTESAYLALVAGKSDETFRDPVGFLNEQYNENVTDEFIPPAVSKTYGGMKDGDAVIFYNFRADRARQLTAALHQTEFPYFRRESFPTLSDFVTMTCYDSSFTVPCAFEKSPLPNTLGEVVSRKGWKQLRIAETEKYAHVTYFFNGGEEKVFEGEKRVLIPSPRDVRTYDMKPEMSAQAVTDELLKELNTGVYQFVVVNFANPDMVGHTGNLGAAIKAVETVDKCLGKIVDWIEGHEAFGILTADHGNCEQMIDPQGMPLTSHTLLPVPVILIDKRRPNAVIREGGRLCDLAPTMLELFGEPVPSEMTGKSLIS